MKLVNILRRGVNVGASDIHLTVGIRPIIRVNGSLNKVGNEKLTPQDLENFVLELLPKNSQKKRELQKEGQTDLGYQWNEYRFRINVYYQRGNPAIAFRIIPNKILSLNELGVPMKVKDVITEPRGLFLVTGPTGSGKSTTLAAMIDLINSQDDKHIITLEDPIEYTHSHEQSIINQRAVGEDTDSFADGLRAALRQDPDIIMVGEMRDLETISTAITAAGTGHLVLATLHTNGASETIDRIIDVFPPHQQSQIRSQLSLTLMGVLSQQLLPTIDGRNKVLATELMMANSAVRNLIREGKVHQIESVMQTGKQSGMHTMDYSLRDLYRQGKINREQALTRALNRETLESLI
ncbi:type IV pilus twitching motility protein PilT [Halanaerobacter jeridensis]|uniref:Twitching motility protein PilT n=1 Tax=Halanaerobacter jeridensis TaxID=706427 RepID=A0A938XYD7_9FIRM|nr:type IV pilus twitching motility protein PilT [Halanaerobacter jeridensis]MBM7557957.1 twitching motility protein PilT [Halanaerobacter jeridensis]